MSLSLFRLAMIVLAIAGCASGGAVSQDHDPMLVVLGNGTNVRYSRDVHVVTTSLAGSPVSLWPALKAAVTSLGLPVTVVDSANRLIAAQNAELNGRFQNAPVSRVLDCGRTAMGVPRADSYRVWLTVGSQLQGAGTGSAMRTTVFAMAQDPSSSTTAVQCASTGVLESDLAKRMGAQ